MNPKGRPRRVPRRVSVQRVEQLSPRMRRVTFEGSDLATFEWPGPAAHLKIVFPVPGSTAVPDYDPDGPRLTTIRTYTPRRFDAAAKTLDVDFVLHGEGPGSSWAAQAQAGQEVIVLGPASGYPVDAEADWYVLAGDDSALPAIETLLEAIPARASVSAFIEIPEEHEQRTLAAARAAEIRWLIRDERKASPASALLAALSNFAWPAGDGRIYVGCEADGMRRIRSAIVTACGLDRARIVTRGYWRQGAVNHPDHDYATD
jgi:NADPH-dependent ferric siderophore reductase